MVNATSPKTAGPTPTIATTTITAITRSRLPFLDFFLQSTFKSQFYLKNAVHMDPSQASILESLGSALFISCPDL